MASHNEDTTTLPQSITQELPSDTNRHPGLSQPIPSVSSTDSRSFTSAPVEMDDISTSNTQLQQQHSPPSQPNLTSDPTPPSNMSSSEATKENQNPNASTLNPIEPSPSSKNPEASTTQQNAALSSPSNPTQSSSSSSPPSTPPKPINRTATEPAIGAAIPDPTSSTTEEPPLPPQPSSLAAETDDAAIATATAEEEEIGAGSKEIVDTVLNITLLLHTGARHPYKIDEKYLKKRNVNVTENSPMNMSIYTLKELIWRDWRQDGRFQAGESPNVVHMTIKPQDVIDDEDARMAKTGGRDADGNERSPGCRCVIL
ncbi:hypothetical protein MMC25_005907 [Agyrium rufum]|nr:hypothetical protein [Agyrium rufum]